MIYNIVIYNNTDKIRSLLLRV